MWCRASIFTSATAALRLGGTMASNSQSSPNAPFSCNIESGEPSSFRVCKNMSALSCSAQKVASGTERIQERGSEGSNAEATMHEPDDDDDDGHDEFDGQDQPNTIEECDTPGTLKYLKRTFCLWAVYLQISSKTQNIPREKLWYYKTVDIAWVGFLEFLVRILPTLL